MNKLNDVVLNYLKMDTNYALMITGEWGVGKTYYFKKNLSSKIKDTHVFKDHQKRYKPVLISLFGLKSIEEIQVEILLALYPIFKTSKFKLGATVGKILIKGLLHLKGLGEYGNLVEEIKVDKKSLINIEELVLCFDDLERISQDLNLEELIGYINSLVEAYNAKILIIANEGKISEQNFAILKEKVIGNSIEFIPNNEETLEGILLEKFNGYQTYMNFLKKNSKLILTLFTRGSSNFRILTFALSYYHTIFSAVSNQLPCDEKLKLIQQDVFLDLLKFTISISNEYKLGFISYKKRNSLDVFDMNTSLLSKKFTGSHEKGSSELTYRDKFIQQYYINEKFNYYNSVYDYVTGGSILDINLLLNEIKENHHLSEDGILPQYEVFEKLSYENCFTLNNDEYKKLTRTMLSFAYQGKYEIDLYLTIFDFALRFENPLNLKPNRIKRLLIKGLIKGKETYRYKRALRLRLHIPSTIHNKEFFEEIRKEIIALNDKIHDESLNKESKELELLCYNDFDQFSETVLNHQLPYYQRPIMANFDIKKFYSFFYNSGPQQRWEIITFFINRYQLHLSSSLKEEVSFLAQLKQKVNLGGKRYSKNITGIVYSEFEKALETAVNNLGSL
jgi:hypothetical protein